MNEYLQRLNEFSPTYFSVMNNSYGDKTEFQANATLEYATINGVTIKVRFDAKADAFGTVLDNLFEQMLDHKMLTVVSTDDTVVISKNSVIEEINERGRS